MHKKKGIDKLRQELFNSHLKPSLQENFIILVQQNHTTEISEMTHPEKIPSYIKNDPNLYFT